MAYSLDTQPTFQPLLPGQGGVTTQPVTPPGGTPTGDVLNNPPAPSQPPADPSQAQNPLFQGMDPRLVSVFQQYGMTPTGPGTGNTDIAYWNQKITAPGADANYFLGRLGSDFAGTGPDLGGTAPGGGATGASAPGGFSAGTFTPPAYSPSGIFAGAPGGAQAGGLFDTLMKRAQQSEVVDPNDPIIKAQTNAYDASQQRGVKNYLSSLAEKQGAGANLGAERRMAGEAAGTATSNFQAQLMANELASRRQEIQQALSGATGLLTGEQQMQLAEELAKLDSAQRAFEFSTGQGQQESQFARQLAQRAFEFDTSGYNQLYA